MKPNFFVGNRHNLGSVLEGGLFVVSAYDLMQRSNDLAHAFEQDANFWYLAGIDEPGYCMVYDGTKQKSWLVNPNLTESEKIFDGFIANADSKTISGVDDVIEPDEFEPLLRQLHRNHSTVYTVMPAKNSYPFANNPSSKRLVSQLERIFDRVIDCKYDIAKMRALKQKEEIVAIKKAIRVTSDAFSKVRESIKNLRYEFEIESVFSAEIRRQNGRHAYDPIIASGPNACVLHYSRNSSLMKKTSSVLCDVGARVDGYAADITRVISVNGSPSDRQKNIHDSLLSAQRDIINFIGPGVKVIDYQKYVESRMSEALNGIGINIADDKQKLFKYMPHSVSHGLGIDVHDSLGKSEVFKEDMVLTVEPGIYIEDEGIGMRIEDDILVTGGGRQNMSKMISTEL